MTPSASSLPIIMNCQYPLRPGIPTPYPKVESDQKAADGGHRRHELFARLVRGEPVPAAEDPEGVVPALLEHFQARRQAGGLRDPIPELAFAWHPVTHEVKLLGSDIGRRYREAGAQLGEIPGTSDLVSWDPDGLLRVDDFKTGYGEFDPVETNEQFWFNGMVAARHYKKTMVRIASLHVTPSRVIERTHVLISMDLVLFEERLRRALEHAAKANPVPGEHCQFCQLAGKCPATERTFQALLQNPELSLDISTEAQESAWATYLPILDKALKQVREELKRRADAKGGIMMGGGKVWKAITFEKQTFSQKKAIELLGERAQECYGSVQVTQHKAVKA